MLSLKTPSNFGLVLTLSFLQIRFFVCFIFILHTTQILALHKKWPYRSYIGPYFPSFGLNMERYSVFFLRIQSDCGKIRTRITPNTDTFYAVQLFSLVARNMVLPVSLDFKINPELLRSEIFSQLNLALIRVYSN